MKKIITAIVLLHLSFSISAQNISLEPSILRFNPNLGLRTTSVNAPSLQIVSSNTTAQPSLTFVNSSNNFLGTITGSESDNFSFSASKGFNFQTISGFNFIDAMNISKEGNVGINTESPTTKFEVNGFSKLGSDAPAIKVKKLTGTSSPSQGGAVSIAHGLTASKILNVSVILDFGTNAFIPTSYNYNSGYEFDWYSDATNIIVANKSGNSGNILLRPFKILITYEE